MRNPNRIPNLTGLFQTYWMTVGTDLRFGQVLELMAQDYAGRVSRLRKAQRFLLYRGRALGNRVGLWTE